MKVKYTVKSLYNFMLKMYNFSNSAELASAHINITGEHKIMDQLNFYLGFN